MAARWSLKNTQTSSSALSLCLLLVALLLLCSGIHAQFGLGAPIAPALGSTANIRPGVPSGSAFPPSGGGASSATTTTSNQCQITDPLLGCTTCQGVISYISNELEKLLSVAQAGCTQDYQCSLQSVSTFCGESCLAPLLTSKSQLLSDQIYLFNQQQCDNQSFQTQCKSFITQRGTSRGGKQIQCIEEESYCQKSTGNCAKRNKLVAAATEIFATPTQIHGIGSNPNGIDGLYREPATGIIIATSTVPIPTSENVSNVISNIPLPHGAPAPPGTTINQN